MKQTLLALSTVLTLGSAPATALATSADDLRAVSPALERYTRERLLGEVWERPGLVARDRAIVTVAALVARQQTAELAFYLDRALDAGVKPSELSELITHLAFYAGWGNAMAAVPLARSVFAKRGVKPEDLPEVAPRLLPLDTATEARRESGVQAHVGPVSPGLVQYTRDVLFLDLWQRPALAPRDRSLVTVSALIANGQVAQVTFHLNRAMDNGLTQPQAAEVLSHLAFYTGWPNVFSAVPVAKAVFESRPR
ncbi:MAG: carboxymuconolactone decarboxylase family protein [Hydrogenophaga sp.]|nr:carboxymuconolactone decarboxylase family protein [Hydrogenophaga sp.]